MWQVPSFAELAKEAAWGYWQSMPEPMSREWFEKWWREHPQPEAWEAAARAVVAALDTPAPGVDEVVEAAWHLEEWLRDRLCRPCVLGRGEHDGCRGCRILSAQTDAREAVRAMLKAISYRSAAAGGDGPGPAQADPMVCSKCGRWLVFTRTPELVHYGRLDCPEHGFVRWAKKPAVKEGEGGSGRVGG